MSRFRISNPELPHPIGHLLLAIRTSEVMNRLKQFFPPLEWAPQYTPEALKGDLVAGLTVGVMLIPQGMAYALIAGLPPIYGLYAALVPLVVYALFGTSRQLAVGPVAMVSLLVAAGVAPLAGDDVERSRLRDLTTSTRSYGARWNRPVPSTGRRCSSVQAASRCWSG
jgi:hypothetical protein